jgi:hypothetical protein
MVGNDGLRKTALRFYTLDTENGLLASLKFVESSEFPTGVYLPEDSTVAIGADDQGKAESAYLVTNEGSLYQVNLTLSRNGGDLFEGLKRIGHFQALSAGSDETGPRIVKIDPSGRNVWMYNPGGVALNIRRPAFGRPARTANIRRPAFVRSQEVPALVFAQLSAKHNKLASSSVLSDAFIDDVSISGLVLQGVGRGLLSTFSGRVFSIELSEGSAEPGMENLGEIGSRVDYLSYNPARDNIVAISSREYLRDGVSSPGALIVASRKENRSSPVTLSINGLLSKASAPLGGVVTSIRRPCNLGR